MPVNSELLAGVKSKQYVLFARAGVAVPSHDMFQEQIHDAMMTQFKHHVSSAKLTPGTPKNIYYRTLKHLDVEVTNKDFHTGISLWRKFSSIKKYVNNNITSIFVKHLGPDGQPPSGHTMENVLLKTRKDLFEAEQESSRAKSKNPAGHKKIGFKITWFPVKWEVFLNFGRASAQPERHFYLE